MSAKIDALISEVRNMPGFVKASATDPERLEQFEAMGRALHAVDRKADDDPRMIEIVDKIQSVVGRTDLPIKQRLLEVETRLQSCRTCI
jgi:hypothetical protein